jgi:hypothetical protein
MTAVRVGLFLSVVVMTALRLPAQAPCDACDSGKPSEETITMWLESGDSRLVAWGATFALKTHDTALVPVMVGLARNWNPLPKVPLAAGTGPPRRDERDVLRAAAMAEVLNSLIEMGAPLEVDVLQTLALDFPAQVIVLAAKMRPQEVQGLLMGWFRLPEQDNDWASQSLRRAAAGMLALHPAPGFAAELLRGTHIWLNVNVVSRGGDGNNFGMGSGGCGGGHLRGRRAGWPVIEIPVPHETYPTDDSSPVLIPGTDPIHLSKGTELSGSCFNSLYLDDRKRGRLVAQMMGVASKELAWGQHGPKWILYDSQDGYVADLAELIRVEESSLRETTARLVALGELTAEEASTALPQIELWCSDQRREPLTPLPQPLFPYPNVTWTKEARDYQMAQIWD